MLKVPVDFPHPGATGYLSPHGEAARIIQRYPDGGYLVQRRRHPDMAPCASDTFRAEPGTLFANQEAAIGKRPAKKRRAA